MNPTIRKATVSDLEACRIVRGQTRDNPISLEALDSFGVTETSWIEPLESGKYIGLVYEVEGDILGFCYANTETSEILVLALHESVDGQGIGKSLLSRMIAWMKDLGHKSLWLAASVDPKIKAHGFYRHLGWKPTGKIDENGDEILNLEL